MRSPGPPVLLNTSFNNDAEPIVRSVHDAVTTYLTTRLDHLVIGDHLVTRVAEGRPRIGPLTVELGRSTQLAETAHRGPRGTARTRKIYFDHSTTYGEHQEISAEAYALLARADGTAPLDELAGGALPAALGAEVYELWRRRFLVLRPR